MSPVAGPIPLLLVADSADTCEYIASALLSAPAFYRIERVTSAEAAQDPPPNDVRLALVDHSLVHAGQPQVVQRLNAANIAVVALIDPQDVHNLQEVVLAGTTSLVPTPFTDTQLWETVEAALARGARPVAAEATPRGPQPSAQARGVLVALFGPKGGCGTSVLAANLAVAIQERSAHGVVLVEVGEGGGSQSVLLNLRTERTMGDLLARFAPGDTDLLSGALTAHSSGVRVLLAPPSAGVRVPPDFLDEVIELLRHMFDFVVVDLHDGSKNSMVNIIQSAHAALLVTVPEMTALHQSRLLVETVQATMPDVRLNVVLNRATLGVGVPADAIRRHLKMQIAAEIPDDQQLVTAAVNRGIPFVISHPRSAAARAVHKLAQELAPEDNRTQLRPEEGIAQPIGLLGRFGFGRRG